VTEAVAMFFGRLSRSADWLRKMVGVPENQLQKVVGVSQKALQLQQMIFSRWAQVMVNFERALYANPEQDLDALWWNLVEKFQLVKPVEGRKAPDWATKIHICTAPVYYHNYMLGELLASQMRHFLVKNVLNMPVQSDVGFAGMPEVGHYFRNRLFAPGAQFPWSELIQKITGEPLTPKYFVGQFVE
jgi:peptidyl-dipeptidase A